MELFKTDSLWEAREKLSRNTKHVPMKTQEVPLDQALSRFCGEDVIASKPVPAFRRSTVDGYAVLAEDTYGAGESSPVFFRIAGKVRIEEQVLRPQNPGEAVQVQTGSMIPANATGVLMLEYAEEYAPGKLAGYRAVSVGENIVEAGEDVKAGTCVIPRGRRISAHQVGILAAMGRKSVKVFVPPAVTVISTGDELVDVGEELSGSQIWDINSYTLADSVRQQGMKVIRRLRILDDEQAILHAVREATVDSDIVLISGGSSKGDKDYTTGILEKVSHNVFTHGIAIKPGKPTVLAWDEERRTLLAGLPGHPMAAMMMLQLLILDWYYQRMGARTPLPWPAVMGENVSSNQGRETCLLVELVMGDEGYQAMPVYAKSGSISGLSRADGYILIKRSREGLKQGERVWVERFL